MTGAVDAVARVLLGQMVPVVRGTHRQKVRAYLRHLPFARAVETGAIRATRSYRRAAHKALVLHAKAMKKATGFDAWIDEPVMSDLAGVTR